MEFHHYSVLLNETIENLNIRPDGIYVDGTLGGGGHSYQILKRLGENGRLIGIDQDADAIQALKQRILGEKGHLSNELSGQFLGEVLHDHFNTVILGHLSKENNYAELAYETVRLEVTMGENPYKGDDFPMYVAKRDAPSERIIF